MSRKWGRLPLALAGIATLVVVATAAFLVMHWWQDQAKTFRPIPADAEFAPSSTSGHFELSAVVELRYLERERRRVVTFDITIANLTDEPVRGLVVTSELPCSLAAYSGAQLLTFGQMDALDLVPNQVPYGLTVSRIQALPDPFNMSAEDRSRFYDALRRPIKVVLWWDDGQEYLLIDPKDFVFRGFPGMG